MSFEIKTIAHPEWKPLPNDGCINVEVKALTEFDHSFLAMLRFQPNGTIHEHSADINIDVICLEGQGMTSVAGEQAPIKAGEQVHWPAGLPHRLWTEDQGMQTLMVEHKSKSKPKAASTKSTPTDKMRHFLQQRHYASLATYHPNESIHVTPLYYLFEDERFYVPCGRNSRKAKNIRLNPQATILVDSRKIGYQGWVFATGNVEIIEGDAAIDLSMRIFQRYYTPETFANDQLSGVLNAIAKHNVVLCLSPERWQSWDIREMDQAHTGGIMTREPEKWFLPLDG
ncbi:MAG: pyridoxamine 5'-phosphate oxidase family protein [Chloroflexota bacterium]